MSWFTKRRSTPPTDPAHEEDQPVARLSGQRFSDLEINQHDEIERLVGLLVAAEQHLCWLLPNVTGSRAARAEALDWLAAAHRIERGQRVWVTHWIWVTDGGRAQVILAGTVEDWRFDGRGQPVIVVRLDPAYTDLAGAAADADGLLTVAFRESWRVRDAGGSDEGSRS
jgi:hypothetical protein